MTISYASVAEAADLRVVDAIRAAISSGQISPGTKLPEEVLAEQFATTRARIRLAFQNLAFEELVEIKRNRGAFVAAPTPIEARHVFEARQVIERATTEIVTRTITTRQIRSLAEILDSRGRDWDLGKREVAIDGISQFHRALGALAHNVALTIALERLVLRTSLILGLYGTSRGFVSAPARYWALLRTIESGDSGAAADLMDRCLNQMLRDLDLRTENGRDEERGYAPVMLRA